MNILATTSIACLLACATPLAVAQDAPAQTAKPAFDAELAKKTGADDYGMRSYVLVILRTGHHMKAPYEWAHHVSRGRACGMSDARIAAIAG